MNPLNLEGGGGGGGGRENLEVVYFPGTNLFEILRGGYLLGGGGCISWGDLVLFGASVIT